MAKIRVSGGSPPSDLAWLDAKLAHLGDDVVVDIFVWPHDAAMAVWKVPRVITVPGWAIDGGIGP